MWTAVDSVEGKDLNGQSLWHARPFFGLPRLAIINNPEGDSLIEKAKAKEVAILAKSSCESRRAGEDGDQNMVMVERGGGGASLDATDDDDIVKVH